MDITKFYYRLFWQLIFSDPGETHYLQFHSQTTDFLKTIP